MIDITTCMYPHFRPCSRSESVRFSFNSFLLFASPFFAKTMELLRADFRIEKPGRGNSHALLVVCPGSGLFTSRMQFVVSPQYVFILFYFNFVSGCSQACDACMVQGRKIGPFWQNTKLSLLQLTEWLNVLPPRPVESHVRTLPANCLTPFQSCSRSLNSALGSCQGGQPSPGCRFRVNIV